MSDPYKVLGVPSGASDDEVKAAYRELVKKYHPDNYANNPLADLAEEKMKEINEAYDTVMRQRSGGSGGGSYQGGGNYQGGSGGSGRYAGIRNLINNGRLAQAERELDAVASSDRDAEWHFLRGSVYYKNGWTGEAYNQFQQAAGMEPGNPEYQQAVQRMAWQMNGGGFGGFGRGGSPYGGYNGGAPGGCNGCDICSALMCADCLCNNGGC